MIVTRGRTPFGVALILGTLGALSACGGSGGDSSTSSAGQSTTPAATSTATTAQSGTTSQPEPTPQPGPTAQPGPIISGTPLSTVVAGSAYAFAPTASDPNGGSLIFSIQNLPSWAKFNTASGQLTGTPSSSNVGNYSNIKISVSDGTATAALQPFSITVTTPSTAGMTLSQQYPGDVGMASDPSVVWTENFEEGSVSAVLGRYDTYDHSAGMALVADHPATSSGSYAMEFTSGGSNPATHIYKSFGTGYDELYFRYYVKYLGDGPWHHSGLWFGGYNPALTYPDPRAGLRPAGNDLFSIGLEPFSAFTNMQMDFYAYWMGMHSWKSAPTGAPGDYYGNSFVHNAEFIMQSGIWVCYEVHLKLNPDPTSGAGAILEVWENDNLIRRFDDTGPYGYWVADKFCPSDADGGECTTYRPANPVLALLDQQWRSTTALKINYFWPQNYNTASTNSSLLFDDMVVATQRVGCTVKK